MLTISILFRFETIRLKFVMNLKYHLTVNSPSCLHYWDIVFKWFWNIFFHDLVINTMGVVYSTTSMLTLKWPRYFHSRWCPRGFMEPPKKTIFPPKFCNEICTIYVRTVKNHNSTINKNCCTVSKWRPNNLFLFRVISILAKIWKTSFPKEFFNEIWLKIGEHN